MIKSWRHKGLRYFYLTGCTSGINVEHTLKIKDILQRLDSAVRPEQLNVPGFNWHKLKGKEKNCYAVTVRANWRIVFQFEEQNAILIDYIDYHKKGGY
jgi:toxin HigB-1